MSLDLESYILGKKAGGGGEEPTGTIDITTNGITNVKSYASANVNVQPDLESKTVTITENTTTVIEPTTGKDGISSVSVITNIPSTGDDWSDIGYSSTPEIVSNMHNTAKTIYDNWDSSTTSGYTTFYNNQDLWIMPKIDTSNITGSAEQMFYYCVHLMEVPKLVMTPTNCSKMFRYCSLLEDLDLSGIDTQNCTSFNEMFRNCSNLKNLDLSSFNTQSVVNVQDMFNACTKLTSITFGNNFKLSSVTNLSNMFAYVSSIKTIDISTFDCQPTNLSGMFQQCQEIQTINFGNNFDTSLVTNMSNMFNGTSKIDSNTLNQILLLCINATNITNKKLTYLGFNQYSYPLSKFETLSNWQDFLDAGWTTGY